MAVYFTISYAPKYSNLIIKIYKVCHNIFLTVFSKNEFQHFNLSKKNKKIFQVYGSISPFNFQSYDS